MNNQEPLYTQRRLGIPTEVPPAYIKPRPGINGTVADHLGIYLPNDLTAQVEDGKSEQWLMSLVTVTAPIQQVSLYEGITNVQQYNETNLNCLTFSGPKRIEILTVDDVNATPYLVFQEVITGNAVTGWQIYAPTPFEIADASHLPPNTWQHAVSTEPVSIKQVRLYENCNFSIETPPPPTPGALFQKVTTQTLSEIDLWR